MSFSFWFCFKLTFILFYFSISALVAYLIYKEEIKYYKPIYIDSKKIGKSISENQVNLHDEFDEFARRDKKVNFFYLFLGILSMFWFKFIGVVICSFILQVIIKGKIKGNKKLSEKDVKYIKDKVSFFMSIILRLSGIICKNERLPDEKVLLVYQKYFGPDYKLDYDGKFCCYISNHTALNDILLAMNYFSCGFVAKDEVEKVPILGSICTSLQTLFVDRKDPKKRNEVVEKIIERQKSYYSNSNSIIPIMIYPEGTTTSGRHLLKFKKGAFASCLPIKPSFIRANLNKDLHLSCGSTSPGYNYLRSLTDFFVLTDFIELPIMTPNEYMYSNFSNLGREKWEIYAEVAREIMCELGNFQKSNKGLRDSYRYEYCAKNNTWVEREKFKIE